MFAVAGALEEQALTIADPPDFAPLPPGVEACELVSCDQPDYKDFDEMLASMAPAVDPPPGGRSFDKAAWEPPAAP